MGGALSRADGGASGGTGGGRDIAGGAQGPRAEPPSSSSSSSSSSSRTGRLTTSLLSDAPVPTLRLPPSSSSATASSVVSSEDGSGAVGLRWLRILSSSPIPQTAQCDAGGASSSSAPPPPPPPPPTSSSSGTPPPPPPPPPSQQQPQQGSSTTTKDGDTNDKAIADAAQQASSLLPPNPGPFEQATYDVRRLISLDTFDGFRCDINKQVSPFMAAVHSFWLGTSMIPDGRKSTYTFLTQVADDRGLYMARIDPSKWSLDGRVHRAIWGGLAMAKLQVSVTPPSSSGGGNGGNGNDAEGGGGASSSDQLLAELDFGGLTWTGNVKYGSMGGGIVMGCNYYQALTSRLSAGGEGMYVAANQALLSNYLVKYTFPAATGDEDLSLGSSPTTAATTTPAATPSSSSSLTTSAGGGSSTLCLGYNAGHGAATLGYRRVVTPQRVQLAAELQFSPFTLDSKLLLGAEFKLARSKLGVCVDAGDGRIQTLLEAKLGMAPGSPTLNLSADVNHWEDEMRFGYGLTVDG